MAEFNSLGQHKIDNDFEEFQSRFYGFSTHQAFATLRTQNLSVAILMAQVSML
jgi:hypothetical protein